MLSALCLSHLGGCKQFRSYKKSRGTCQPSYRAIKGVWAEIFLSYAGDWSPKLTFSIECQKSGKHSTIKQAVSGILGVDVQENTGGTPEARSRLCICLTSFLMTIATGGIPQIGSWHNNPCNHHLGQEPKRVPTPSGPPLGHVTGPPSLPWTEI